MKKLTQLTIAGVLLCCSLPALAENDVCDRQVYPEDQRFFNDPQYISNLMEGNVKCVVDGNVVRCTDQKTKVQVCLRCNHPQATWTSVGGNHYICSNLLD